MRRSSSTMSRSSVVVARRHGGEAGNCSLLGLQIDLTAELRGRDVAEPLAVTAAADDIGPCRADGVGAVHGSDRADLRTVADNRIGHIAGDHANDRDRDGCKSQEYRQ